MSLQTAEPRAGATKSVIRGLGFALLACIAVALITGAALLPFYQASADRAHASVAAMQSSAPLGFVRGLHHWASALAIICGGGLLLCALLGGLYRRPMHIAWLAGIAATLCVFLLQVTGHLLPWDQAAVRTAVVETGIAGGAPVAGPLVSRLARGGGEVGPATLALWYRAHVLLLPLAVVLAAGALARAARRAALAPVPVRPAVAAACAAALVLLALLARAPLGPPASPTDYARYDARPEWYVLPLHSLLTLSQRIRPDLGFIGTIVVPTAALLGLVVLPWLDRRQGDRLPPPWVQGTTVVGAVALVLLTLMSAPQMAPPLASATFAPETAAQAAPMPAIRADPALAREGAVAFERNGCRNCHSLQGRGESVGPPLDQEARAHPDVDWQIRHLRDPARVSPGSTMPSFSQLSDRELRALAAYLLRN